MIPYFGATTISIFGLFSIQVWGTLIAVGYCLGTYIAYRRAKRLGLDSEHVVSVAGWMFIAAMIGSRLFHVFVYEPSYYLAHPFEAIDPRQPGFAITGGFIGAIGVFLLYARKHQLNLIAYADTLAWGLPWGCGVGRIGCFLIHDHPGTMTSFVLGVKYPDGQVRHDLGLYLSLVGFLTGILFLILGRKRRPPGFWVAMFFLIDGMSRFFLDDLRVIDARYFGLTPAQWIGAGTVIGMSVWLRSLFKKKSRLVQG